MSSRYFTHGTGANHKGGKCVAVQKTAQHQAPTANHNVKNTEQHTQVPANTHQTATTTQKDTVIYRKRQNNSDS